MIIYAIGDIHGKIKEYKAILANIHKECPDAVTIQIGDFGIGFPGISSKFLGKKDYFFAGNHDNPKECVKSPQCLGDYGPIFDNCFFVRGAYSIDKDWRIPGVSWWEDEELNYQQLCDAKDAYIKSKPQIMFTHDCPETVKRLWWPQFNDNVSRTQQGLDSLWQAHAPRYWFLGHFHQSMNQVIGGTRFICLKELEVMKIDNNLLDI
jgi:hypothetical protein